MARHCRLCDRQVVPVKKIGAGFWIMALFTSGFWLLTYPFKSKSYCPICKAKV